MNAPVASEDRRDDKRQREQDHRQNQPATAYWQDERNDASEQRGERPPIERIEKFVHNRSIQFTPCRTATTCALLAAFGTRRHQILHGVESHVVPGLRRSGTEREALLREDGPGEASIRFLGVRDVETMLHVHLLT